MKASLCKNTSESIEFDVLEDSGEDIRCRNIKERQP